MNALRTPFVLSLSKDQRSSQSYFDKLSTSGETQ